MKTICIKAIQFNACLLLVNNCLPAEFFKKMYHAVVNNTPGFRYQTIKAEYDFIDYYLYTFKHDLNYNITHNITRNPIDCFNTTRGLKEAAEKTKKLVYLFNISLQKISTNGIITDSIKKRLTDDIKNYILLHEDIVDNSNLLDAQKNNIQNLNDKRTLENIKVFILDIVKPLEQQFTVLITTLQAHHSAFSDIVTQDELRKLALEAQQALEIYQTIDTMHGLSKNIAMKNRIAKWAIGTTAAAGAAYLLYKNGDRIAPLVPANIADRSSSIFSSLKAKFSSFFSKASTSNNTISPTIPERLSHSTKVE